MNKKIILKKNEDRRIRSGHLWIFSNEIRNIEEGIVSGDIVDVYDSGEKYLATGFYNKSSLIAVRVLSLLRFDSLNELIKSRISSAYQLRKDLYPNRDSYRLVFSESDFLPGLIIDKYSDTYVLQIYSIGVEKNINIIVDVLKNELNAKNIFTKNEEYFRRLENLPIEDKIYLGTSETIIITDGIIQYSIDFDKGQKTGFYFDQSDNRFFIEKLSKGKTVLDCFCNVGGFGLHALKAEASNVTFVDSSSSIIEHLKENIKLNNFPEQEYITKDVFDFLDEEVQNQKIYDIVLIDPPAFAKNKKNLETAKKGYEKLNKLALQVINKDGYLVTSSCSFHLEESEFLRIINKAASKSRKQIQLIHFNNASLDHPSLTSMDETTYLKFAVFRVI